MRLGLHTGEVYGIARRPIHREALRLVIDQAVQHGTKTRASCFAPRKNDEAYALDITADIVQAVDWHVEQGYGGPEFLFSKTGDFPRYIDSHVPLKWCRQGSASHAQPPQVGTAFGRKPSRHQRRGGEGPARHKSEQSTHKYAHLGSGAQRRLMEGLKPAAAAPHELATRTATTSVNEASTEAAQATSAEAHVNQASTPSKSARCAAK